MEILDGELRLGSRAYSPVSAAGPVTVTPV